MEYTLNYELSAEDNQNLEQRIVAYPNPTEGSFEIRVPNYLNEIKLEVYNIHAQLIKSGREEVRNGKINLDLNDSVNGIYFVKLDLEEPVYIKVVKN